MNEAAELKVLQHHKQSGTSMEMIIFMRDYI